MSMREAVIGAIVTLAGGIIASLLQIILGAPDRKPIQSSEDQSKPNHVNEVGLKKRLWIFGLLGSAIGAIFFAIILMFGLSDFTNRDNPPIIPNPVNNPVPNNQLVLVESNQTSVNARDFWIETVHVRDGDTVDIHCTSDTWTLDKDDMEPIGADGYHLQYEWAYLKTANIGSLIGRIGSDGEIFHIGCNKTFTSKNSGVLFITVNDGPTREDNDGTISFSINTYRHR